MKEVARHEKHLLISFVNLTYRQLSDFKEDPEAEIAARIEAAVADESLDAAALRDVLKQAGTLYMKPANIYIPPKDRNTWNRLRNSISAFYESVTDPANSMKNVTEL